LDYIEKAPPSSNREGVQKNLEWLFKICMSGPNISSVSLSPEKHIFLPLRKLGTWEGLLEKGEIKTMPWSSLKTL